ncbi:ATP-binding protein [Acetobacterium bakii]|uniref:AAA+ ATPase domain-containing protein n=1 Tax=Acetobacterium bakii TaxID=52689 RepID=A0A0L6TZK7_9FIRM|nr:ATP-binding protein [Acetobacterium bakii]KNZ40995.1 hypothetical protein AKG39_14925 [Acetobacterium bakii]
MKNKIQTSNELIGETGGSIRPNFLGEHPIVTGKYKIKTSVVEEVINKIDEAIRFRVQGLIIYGPSGYGKSTAVEIIKNEICEKYNNEILAFISTMPDPIKNSNVFYSRLLKATGHDLYNKGSVQDKSDRLCSQLVSLALEENRNKKILLFIDEADALDKTDFQCLKDINNQLDLEKIGMTTILIGTEDLISQRNLFSGKKETQIIRRFMEKTYVFNGIKSKNELQDVLAAYDFCMKYPGDSDWSFTKYYFPEAFENGMYLSHVTQDLYKCICNTYGDKIFKSHGLSMNHLCKIVEYLFLKYGTDGAGENWITSEMIAKSVEFRDCNHEQDLLDACASGKTRR